MTLAIDSAKRPLKLFTAGLLTESSDLTPIPTTADDWRVALPGENAGFPDVLEIFHDLAVAKKWEVTQSIFAAALPPGGRTVTSVYEHLRDTILEDLRQALPVDGILLQLHGAMMAHGYDDCEGDLLVQMRKIVGPEVPIGVELDPHCHITKSMMSAATLIVLYKTYFHTDMKERAIDLFRLIEDVLEGRSKPTMALFDCKMIDAFDEAYEPMGSFLKEVYQRESEQGILSISPVHGYMMANVPDMGSKMLVITEDDLVLAEKTAEDLGRKFFETKGQWNQAGNMESVLDTAQQKNANGEAAVQLVEWSDLSGAGFATDGTQLLQAMLDRGMTNTAVGLIWDPLAVSISHEVGLGAELIMRIGGKATPFSGIPLDLNVVVERTFKNFMAASWIGDVDVGDAAVLRCGDTELLLVSKRVMAYDSRVFSDMGVDITTKDYLLFKTISREEAIPVVGSSLCYRNWPFDKIKEPMWPWHEDPFQLE